jgi:hypothetical protein
VIRSTLGEVRSIITGFLGNLKERGHFVNLCIDVRITLKWRLEYLN